MASSKTDEVNKARPLRVIGRVGSNLLRRMFRRALEERACDSLVG
jgi:hypothetical protein